MYKIIVSVVAFVTTTSCYIVQKQSLPSKQSISKIQKTNVTIYKDNDPVCGGTIIKSNPKETLILTAFHCVKTNDDKPVKHGLVETAWKDLLRFEIKNFDRRNDLAVLIVTDKHRMLTNAYLSLDEPCVGDNLWLIGFGAGEKGIVSKGVVAKKEVKTWNGGDSMLIDITAWYGSSGGGVFDEELNLVGVLVEFGPQYNGHGPETGWMYVISLKPIRDISGM